MDYKFAISTALKTGDNDQFGIRLGQTPHLYTKNNDLYILI